VWWRNLTGDGGLVPWWAITDEGWDLLGFIKFPRYP
jgi:hypothetical protein